jgi:YesN/AraC family two-component response regulator
MKMNHHYGELKASYLFVDIAHKVAAYQEAHPEKEIIRLGIGDVTQPLAKCVVTAMQDAAAALRYSDAYFCKLFKQCFKVNFSAYLNEYRVNKARQLILDPRLSLKDIGAAVGYSDANYFTRVFKRLTGQTPSEYRVAAAEKAAQG